MTDPGAAVTVVVPTRDRRELLLRTLRTVLWQIDVVPEVVVVDDGSRDPALDAVRTLGDDRIRVVRQDRSLGVARARSSGIEAVTTPWVAFVDDDDVWAPDKLRAQLAALTHTGGAGWSCVGAVHVDARGTIVGGQVPPARPDVAGAVLRANVVPGGGSGLLARTDLVRDVGAFDPTLSNLADWDLATRLALRSPCAPVPRPLVGYLVAPTGMAHDIARGRRELRYITKKYADERRARGISVDWPRWLAYFALLADDAGQRWASTRLHAELVVRHRRALSLGSLALNAMPRAVLRARLRSSVRRLPAGWMSEAQLWLDEVPPVRAVVAGADQRRPVGR